MTLSKYTRALSAGAILALVAGSHALVAQNLEPAQILHPAPDTWPNYHGDYSGQRHSHLTQINTRNVDGLGLAWAFQTNQPAQIKSSPLLVDGILYFTVPDTCFGITTIPPRTVSTSAIAGWQCTRDGSTSLRPMLILSV